jgi:predicted PurR-regulated permease PerM
MEGKPKSSNTVLWVCIVLTLLLFIQILVNQQQSKEFEYGVQWIPADKTQELLDKLAEQRWEIVHARRAHDNDMKEFGYELIVKRDK